MRKNAFCTHYASGVRGEARRRLFSAERGLDSLRAVGHSIFSGMQLASR